MALTNRSVFMLSLLLVAVAPSASLSSLTLPPLVPAFAWSNHRQLDLGLPSISYQTVSSEDFVENVKRKFVSQQDEDVVEQDVDLDVVLVFVGRKLRSGDVPRVTGAGTTSDLLQVLNRVVTSSNSSVSLPYVAPPGDGASVRDVLVREFVFKGSESRLGEVTLVACDGNAPQAKGLPMSVLEYVGARMRMRLVGETDFVVVCGDSEAEESLGSEALSEGEILDGILRGLDEIKARYVASYITDLSGEKPFVSRSRGRQLGSVVYEGEEYCNEVCRTKALLLEGLLVGLTLLIILISGLCCMAGITTPSRFEQSKEVQ